MALGIRRRSAGVTYRAIGSLGVSHVHARRLREEAYREVAETTQHDAIVALGEELDRLDSLI